MNIVILDGGTTNPGDLSWAPLEALGTLTVYPDTPPELVLDRARNAQAVIVNRVHLTREMIDAMPELAYIGTLSIGVNQVDGAAARERGIPLWVRHVVVPGLNDSLEDMGKIKVLAESFSNLEKIEWLPFHNLCVEKYQSLGIPFPLAGTDNMDEEALQRLVEQLNAEGA